MSAISTRNIRFLNKIVDNEIYKTTNGIDPDMGFITCTKNIIELMRLY